MWPKASPKKEHLVASGGNGAGDGVWITFQREKAHQPHRLLCSQLGLDFSVYRDMGITQDLLTQLRKGSGFVYVHAFLMTLRRMLP